MKYKIIPEKKANPKEYEIHDFNNCEIFNFICRELKSWQGTKGFFVFLKKRVEINKLTYTDKEIKNALREYKNIVKSQNKFYKISNLKLNKSVKKIDIETYHNEKLKIEKIVISKPDFNFPENNKIEIIKVIGLGNFEYKAFCIKFIFPKLIMNIEPFDIYQIY